VDDQSIWELVTNTWSALGQHFEPIMEKAGLEMNLEPRQWGLLMAVKTFEPEDTTPAHLVVRSPYTAVESYQNRLDAAARSGFLIEVEEGKYRLADHGRMAIEKLIDVGRSVMAQVDPLPRANSNLVAELLDRIIQSSLTTPPPPDKWSMNLSLKLMPLPQPPMPYIEQEFTALAAYRDDAHLAAWQASGLSATALETLTIFWKGEANSLETLCKRLENRGHPCHVYQDSLEELRRHGYLQGPEHSPWLTGAGRVFRNKVEDDTNRYFFASWICLSDKARKTLVELLSSLKAGLSQQLANYNYSE
jgi:hypothetical protein